MKLRKTFRFMVVLVAILALVVLLPERLHAATCIETYEQETMRSFDDLYNCGTTATRTYAWYDPRRAVMIAACSLEWNSNALESAARYASCMSLGVFIKA